MKFTRPSLPDCHSNKMCSITPLLTKMLSYFPFNIKSPNKVEIQQIKQKSSNTSKFTYILWYKKKVSLNVNNKLSLSIYL